MDTSKIQKEIEMSYSAIYDFLDDVFGMDESKQDFMDRKMMEYMDTIKNEKTV